MAELPLNLDDAVRRALDVGPSYAAIRAEERASHAALDAERSAWLPKVNLVATWAASTTGTSQGDHSFAGRRRGVTAHLGQRGTQPRITQARVALDVASSRRRDAERAAGQEVAAAYHGFTTARAGIDLATTGVAVARETMRVQDVRYRAGETTVLHVLDAQEALTRAESDLVNSRQLARVALAQLESLLGQRLLVTSGANNE